MIPLDCPKAFRKEENMEGERIHFREVIEAGLVGAGIVIALILWFSL